MRDSERESGREGSKSKKENKGGKEQCTHIRIHYQHTGARSLLLKTSSSRTGWANANAITELLESEMAAAADRLGAGNASPEWKHTHTQSPPPPPPSTDCEQSIEQTGHGKGEGVKWEMGVQV